MDERLNGVPARKLLDDAHGHLFMVVRYGISKIDKIDAEHIQAAFALIEVLRKNQ